MSPNAPLGFCATPGCRNRARGRCPACRTTANAVRGNRHQRGYGSRWVEASKRFLAQYLLCGMRPGGQAPVMSRCWEQGFMTAAYQVDHVEAHRNDEARFWDDLGNWQSLCQSCGARKTRAGL